MSRSPSPRLKGGSILSGSGVHRACRQISEVNSICAQFTVSFRFAMMIFTNIPIRRKWRAEYVIPFVVFLLLSGCSLFGGAPTLDSAYTDYSTYANAELVPFPAVSARSLHFHDTRYVLVFEVDCRELPVEDVSTFELLEVPSGGDVEKWIRYRNADFGNEYMDIEPRRRALVAGTVRLVDVRVEKEARPYGEQEINLQRVYYRLKTEGFVFEGGLNVPSVQTEAHSCFVGDGFGGTR